MKLKICFIAIALVCFTNSIYSQNLAPQKNFDVFWNIFNNNYAFFELHKVNWQESYKKYRPLVTNSISNDSLFNVMSTMLKPLGDSHVNLIDAAHKKKFNAAGPSHFAAEFNTDSLKAAFWQTADSTLMKNGFARIKGYGSIFKGKHLFYFSESANFGYLRFSRCFAKIKDGELDEKDFEMEILDSIMAQCSNLKGMIIDVRANIGGDDKFSYEVAGRFTSKPVIGHYKRERIAGTNRYTKTQKWTITPKGKFAFTKPVIILTNDKTVSAAEVFTLAMKQLSQVSTIGTNTEGNLSDMYEQELPNGWTITLSNQKYYSPRMVCYEGIGVPVDVKVSNIKQSLLTMKDPVLDTAIYKLHRF
ncbi:S41 family peptidase [Mucilaginibacter litoreus]|uniref:S41 family peptidase n=1 Tax=Mucilaginibacter litoreus TaxID=1048221 RepID=A0ABW3AZ90_9SPHI